MFRPLFLVFTALSLLLCAVAATMWARSYGSAESFTVYTSAHSAEALSIRGNLYLHIEAAISVDPYSWHTGSRAIRGRDVSIWADKAQFQFAGFSGGFVPPTRFIGVPFWFVMLLTALPGALWLRGFFRNRKRWGACTACGHRLHADGPCPSCGALPPAKRADEAPQGSGRRCVACGALLRIGAMNCRSCGEPVKGKSLRLAMACAAGVILVIGIVGWLLLRRSEPRNAFAFGASKASATSTLKFAEPTSPASAAQIAAMSDSLTSAELTWAFASDKSAAEGRFNEKTIEITGVIDVIGRKISGATYLQFEHSGSSGAAVQCLFPRKNLNALSGLWTGQAVRIEGTCKGFKDNVLIVDCRIVAKP